MLTAILLTGALLTTTTAAQIIGPGPGKHRLEIGGYYGKEKYTRKFIRHYNYGGRSVTTTEGLTDENASATLRYGVTHSIYGVLNFGTVQSKSDYLYGRNGLMGILGAGINAELAGFKDVSVRLSGQYNDYFVMDPDHGVSGWRGRGAEIILAADRSFKVDKHLEFTFGAGMRTYYSNSRYRSNPLTLVYSKNVHYVSLAALAQMKVARFAVIALESMIGDDTEWRLRVGVTI